MSGRANRRWTLEEVAKAFEQRSQESKAPVEINDPSHDLAPPAPPQPKRKRKPPEAAKPAEYESDVLAAILGYLALHPDVSFAYRANTGAFKVEDRYFRSGFPGQSDIIGMMKDARFLAIEAKRKGGGVTAEQHAFLMRVRRHGGVGFVADSIDVVQRELALAKESATL